MKRFTTTDLLHTDNCYMRIEPNSYVFPGAQIFSHQIKELTEVEVYDATSSESDSDSDSSPI